MGPLYFITNAANKLEWAHLFLQQTLSKSLNGPHLYFLTAMSNKLEWAYYFYARC